MDVVFAVVAGVAVFAAVGYAIYMRFVKGDKKALDKVADKVADRF